MRGFPWFLWLPIGLGIVAIVAEQVATKWIIIAASGFLSIMLIFGFIFSWKKGLIDEDVAIDDKIDDYQEETESKIVTEKQPITMTKTESKALE